jgi:hypothetical protein
MVRDRSSDGKFRGHRTNCERVPSLPAGIVSRCLCDPRGTPYLLIWTDSAKGELREMVRLTPFSLPTERTERHRWVELKRWNGERAAIRVVNQALPRGSNALLIVCCKCQNPRRALYAWEANKVCGTLSRGVWNCRYCSELNYTSEGEALVYRTRWPAARPLSGLKLWHRPEPWEPLVFTSPIDAINLGFVQNVLSDHGLLQFKGKK